MTWFRMNSGGGGKDLSFHIDDNEVVCKLETYITKVDNKEAYTRCLGDM